MEEDLTIPIRVIADKKPRLPTRKVKRISGKVTHKKMVERFRKYLIAKYQKRYQSEDLELRKEVPIEKGKRVDITLKFFKKTLTDKLKTAGHEAASYLIKTKTKVYHHFSHILICEVKMKLSEFRQGFGQIKEYRETILQKTLVKKERDILAYLGLPEKAFQQLDSAKWLLLKKDKIGLLVYYKSGVVRSPIKLVRK